MRKTKEESEKTRRIIVDTAFKIFLEKGYAATNLDDIAKAINMSRGVIYWHFKNKLDLFVCLLNKILDESIAKAQEIYQSSESLPDKFKRLLNGDAIGSHSLELIKTFHPGSKDLNLKMLEAAFKAINKKVDRAFGLFTQFILKEQNAGHIRKNIDVKAFVAMFMMVVGFLHAPSYNDDMMPLISVRNNKRNKIIDLLWNGLGSIFETDAKRQ